MQPRPKQRLIITLQLKNAEVYPGSNLHGTVILQLIHKHNHERNRSNSIDSIDLTPKTPTPTPSIQQAQQHSNHYPSPSVSTLTVIDKVSISVLGICKIHPSADTSHFPMHLKSQSDSFNILRGKENILGKALQLKMNQNESIQFDFVVQLPPVLPCSYRGYLIQYLYFAQLNVIVSKHVHRTKCRLPFYVLPNNFKRHEQIPKMMTPINLTERMSVFRKRKSEKYALPIIKNEHVTPMRTESASNASSPTNNSIYKPSPSLLLPVSSDAHFVENNMLSTKHSNQHKVEEQHNISSYMISNNDYYLRRSSLSLNYRDRNNSDEFDELHLIKNHSKRNTDKYRISMDDKCIGVLLLNDTIFVEGDSIEGYLSLYTPCIVRVTLIHIEKCGKNQQHITRCGNQTCVCWYTPSFSFALKVPNSSYKSFESDLCESRWILNFEFAISKEILFEERMSVKGNQLGYLNSSFVS